LEVWNEVEEASVTCRWFAALLDPMLVENAKKS
jgi:hypothetical protein